MKRYRLLLDQRLAPLRSRYDGLAPREQVMVGVMSAVIVLALVYLMIWKPVADEYTRGRSDLDASRALAERIEAIAANLGAVGGGGGGPLVSTDASLLSAVDLATKNGTLGKLPSREQPDGETRVRVFVDGVPFDKLIIWINELQTRYGVSVETLDIDKQTTPGVVDARLSLVRSS